MKPDIRRRTAGHYANLSLFCDKCMFTGIQYESLRLKQNGTVRLSPAGINTRAKPFIAYRLSTFDPG
jgi:hypothetical protein